ncbi:MAG: hypothetical protein BIFFINMI_03627 [Phycisphaerae bacterium]|nr:hypothetical protein [Phycisphaerae bacterium]
MSMSRLAVSVLLVACVLLLPAAAGAVTLGQTDDFQSGDAANWGGGDAPFNVASGGPLGAGDRYLQAEINSETGPGSRLGIRNLAQWLGDYTSGGVTALKVDMNNFSLTNLEIRVLIDGDGGLFTSINAFSLSAGSGWVTAVFDLTASGLTSVGGSDVSATLANVTSLLIRHDPGSPDGLGGSPTIPLESAVGFDNITAVPEPATLSLVILGGGVLLHRRTRRRN